MPSSEKSITEKIPKKLDGKAVFKFVNGPRKSDVVLVSKEVFFIGRSETNDLAVSDRSISRKHAVVNFVDNNYTISDLNSFKGVIVNGDRTKEAVLRSGDRIKLGNTILEFLTDKEAAVAEAHTKKNIPYLRPALFVVFGLVLVIFVLSLIFGGGAKRGDKGKAKTDDLEFYYSQGVRAYNVSKNMAEAASYWQKVLDIDPDGNSVESRNARILLNNLTQQSESVGPDKNQTDSTTGKTESNE
jgi:pSer/pThr/pTyr-binding forkhead associated (FHA) protein